MNGISALIKEILEHQVVPSTMGRYKPPACISDEGP